MVNSVSESYKEAAIGFAIFGAAMVAMGTFFHFLPYLDGLPMDRICQGFAVGGWAVGALSLAVTAILFCAIKSLEKSKPPIEMKDLNGDL